ncbi:TonB-dependent receptor [Pseudomonas schmalbachii]|uniref:TonB-dependent receptor n=1 Tax=Pseudomonas schmalbachii TaxID=2816993 RepID=A0ABS3TKS8_9PSED|nr:TonB-dependent receptor [Pseudomonas schmalbachii]MBO3274251.1 TonB-dependent receptor [Pseudomonas schmalbachii]
MRASVLSLAVGSALAGIVGAALIGSGAVQAAEAVVGEKKRYAIPAGKLSDVLAHFAASAGVPLSFDPRPLSAIHSDGLQGSFSVEEGFARLLAGSGYELVDKGDGAWSLQRLPGTADTLALPASTVTASPRLSGEPMPAYAGGQVATGGQVGILGNRDIMDTPFNQTNYTAELMENQQARHIAAVLNNDPTAHANGATSTGADDFSIRGFYVSNTDLLFGGMPGVAPTFFNSMMAESIERVEVLKGPNALLNGSAPNGSVGGTINLVPKRAGAQPLTQFTPSYASDSQVGGHLDIGRRFGAEQEFGVRFNGVYRDGDTATDHQSRESQLLALGLDYSGESLRLSSDLGYQKQDLEGITDFTSLAAGVPVPDAPDAGDNYDGPYDFSKPEVYYGTVRGEFDFNEHLTGYAAAGGSERNTQYMLNLRTIVDAEGNLAPGNGRMSADKMYSRAQEAGLRGRFETGPVSHQAVLAYSGLDRDWRRINVNLPGAVPASNIYRPVFGPKPDFSLVPDLNDAQTMQDLKLSSVALVDTLSVFEERVQLTLGARQQKIDSTGFGVSYDEKEVTPMAGLVIRPWQEVSFYANYIEGLEQGPTAPDTAANAGEVFAPSVTEQYEVGTKLELDGFGATLSLYQITQPSAFTDPASNIFKVNGEQRHRGMDLNVYGEVMEGVRLLGGAAYIDSELTRTEGGINEGNRGAAVPEWRLILGAEWDTPFMPGLTLSARATRNESMYLDQANTQDIPAWTRLDIGARYRFERGEGKAVTLRANLDNALDDNYWDANSFGQLTLNDPRTLSLSATFDL